MGVIRGSEESVQTPNGYLSREQYLALSDRTNSTFARHREQVYDVFEAYLRQKRDRGRFDPADRCDLILGLFSQSLIITWYLRTHSLLRELSHGTYPSVDFLYALACYRAFEIAYTLSILPQVC